MSTERLITTDYFHFPKVYCDFYLDNKRNSLYSLSLSEIAIKYAFWIAKTGREKDVNRYALFVAYGLKSVHSNDHEAKALKSYLKIIDKKLSEGFQLKIS